MLSHNLYSCERREAMRVAPKEDVWVITSLAPVRMGALLDISATGIGYKCLEDGIESGDEYSLDLFFSKKNLYHENFRVKTVTNQEIQGAVPFRFSTICRTGVEFIDLTEEQKAIIEIIMADYE
jgi:hypothetical protein